MTYAPPSINSSGVTIPTYTDIVNQMVANAQGIFGADIYLGIDSQDYQWISSVASIINDTNQLAQAVYNSRGPATAIGSGLDVIVGINGIVRLPPVYSTCPVQINGTAGLTIQSGVVADTNGNDWSLPNPTIIGSNGTITVTATCQTAGAISAAPGTISTIVTPTLGWTSVVNTVSATVGSSAETDAALRGRQALSTAQPSQTLLEGMQAAIASVPGVTRFRVYENDTSSVNSLGLPANSVTAVVDGTATSSAIAQAIWAHKGPGVLSNGTTTEPVTDQYGVITNISYDVAQYVYLDVTVTLTELTGYTVDTTTAIQQAIPSYLNTATIGGPNVYNSALWGAALSANPAPSNPAFSITGVTAAIHLGASLTAALANATAYTSLAVSALTQPVASGASLIIGTGATTQTVTASAAATVGATSISVNSFTANAAYAVGTQVALAQSTANSPIAYNQVAAGNANYVVVVS